MIKRSTCYAALALCLLITSNTANAQKTEPIFEIKGGNVINKVKFLMQSATGELITGNDLALSAIDPETKTVLWEKNDFLGLDEEDVSVIEGTPFIKIERQKTIAISKNKNVYIIQARDGKVVYDSKDEGIKVRNTLVMKELGGLLVENVKDGFLSVSFVDFAQAKMLWTVPLAKEKSGGIGLGALKRAIKSHFKSSFNVEPKVDASGNLILVLKKEVFCINRAGSIAWKKEYDNNVDDAYLGSDNKSLFIGYKKYIDKLSTENGNSLLKEPIKMRDELNGIEQMGNDYIVYNAAGINIMDADGNMKWKKDTKLGDITQVKYTDKGILALETAKDDEVLFHWVNFEGKEIWDEKSKGGLIFAEPTEKGVMYVTRERANIITYEKGKDLWNKDIKIKGVPYFGVDNKNNIIYAYAKDKIHSFNFNDLSYKLIAEDIDLKKWDDEKEPATIETRADGSMILISTAQNAAMINVADGKVIYNNQFREIGLTKKRWMKALGTAMSVGGAAVQVAGIGSMAKGTGDAAVKGNTNTMQKGANQYVGGLAANDAGNQLFEAADKRYSATQATKDNLYILSEMPEGNGLLVWAKDKGEPSKKITFRDTTPQYVVDEATDRVYIVVGNVINAYSLK